MTLLLLFFKFPLEVIEKNICYLLFPIFKESVSITLPLLSFQSFFFLSIFFSHALIHSSLSCSSFSFNSPYMLLPLTAHFYLSF